jgi:hypothetical protein
MSFRNSAKVAVAALMVVIPLVSIRGSSNAPAEECARTAHLQAYSSAAFSEETGDVIGYELVIQQHNGNSIDALLYDYEGTPNEDGISVSGHISGGKPKLQGIWVEHLIEQPTKKEIVETRLVKVDGTLDLTEFQGTIKIQGLATPISARMKRVDHIWMCQR